MSMPWVKAIVLPTIRGSDAVVAYTFSVIASNLCPFSIIAGRPFVSFAKSGLACGSMLIASLAYNSFCAFSYCPWRQSSTSPVAICGVFMAWVFFILQQKVGHAGE